MHTDFRRINCQRLGHKIGKVFAYIDVMVEDLDRHLRAVVQSLFTNQNRKGFLINVLQEAMSKLVIDRVEDPNYFLSKKFVLLPVRPQAAES